VTTSDDCQYCAYLRDGLPGGWIYEDEHWAAGGFPLNPVPGWIVVMLRRHVEALTDLTGPELATLGPTAARVSSAITHVVEPTKVYFVVFGELNAHFHFLLAPRTADMQPDHRSAVLLTNSRQYADPKRASDIAGRVGALLAGPAR
jgi:diadenosine tetraphosphate (Ap4A) HIT family hydrolase